MNDVNTGMLKARVIELVNEHAKLAQVVNDSLFSFGELGFHEVETSKYLTATLERHGFKVERGVAGMPTGWVARWGIRRTGDSTRKRHRCVAERFAEAGRGLSRAVGGRWPGSRRGPQLGPGGEHRRGARTEGADAERGPARHADAVARHRRGTAGGQGVPGTRRIVRRCRCGAVHPCRRQPRDRLGRGARCRRADLGGIRIPRRVRTCRRSAMARPQRARRGRADEHGLERAPRAPAAGTAFALHHHLRRRTTERRTGTGEGLVLHPRDRRGERAQELRHLQPHRRRCGDDDGYRGDAAHPRRLMAAPLQSGAGGDAAG